MSTTPAYYQLETKDKMSSSSSSTSARNEVVGHNICSFKSKDTTTFFIPAYLVIIAKKVSNFNFSEGTLNLSMTLVLRVITEGLDREQLDQLHDIRMRFNETTIIDFNKKTSEIKTANDGREALMFVRRTAETISFAPHLYNFPFDIQNIDLKFELTSKVLREKEKESVRFNFYVKDIPNTMLIFKNKKKTKGEGFKYVKPLHHKDKSTAENESAKLFENTDPEGDDGYIPPSVVGEKLEDDPDNIQDLNIAYGIIPIPYTPAERKNNGEVYFPVLKARIHLYREPEYVLMACYFPLLVLNIISVCTFALDPLDYPSRLAMIITILLALFAFLPTCRQGIAIPEKTFLDLAIFASVFIIGLVILESVFGAFSLWNWISRLLFPLVSATGIFVMCVFVIVQYIRYRIQKPTIETFGGREHEASSNQFDYHNWKQPKLSLPTAAEPLKKGHENAAE